MNLDSESDNYATSNIEDSDVENLTTKIGDMELNDNFINIKTHPKEENFNVNDTPGTSSDSKIHVRNEFNRPARGYAAITTTVKNEDNYKPYQSMKNEPINPFGIYLDVDCVNNTEEAIDKWETAFRIAVSVNKMDLDTIKGFLERTLLNSALRFWQNMHPDLKNTIFEMDNITANIITRAVETFRLEFCGEGNLIKDPATVQKYTTALLRLQLCDICEIDRYICVFQDYYYHIYNQVLDTNSYLPLFFC
jgi:hypothetical protein